MQTRGLPPGHKTVELIAVKVRKPDVIFPVHRSNMGPVEIVQQFKDDAFPEQRNLIPFMHQMFNMGFLQKAYKLFSGSEILRGPYEFGPAPVKAAAELYSDAHTYAHNPGRLQKLVRGAGLHMIVINHRERTDALHPGVHNQMSGAFPPFGVGIVHMVVKRDLAAVFRHFKQVVACKKLPDYAGVAGGSHSEIVRKFLLQKKITPCPHKLLHYLDQKPARVDPELCARAVKHFVIKRAQRLQALLPASFLQRFQQVYHGVGNALFPAYRKPLDAVGMKDRIEQVAQQGERCVASRKVHNTVHHFHQRTVLPVIKRKTPAGGETALNGILVRHAYPRPDGALLYINFAPGHNPARPAKPCAFRQGVRRGRI